MHSYQTLIATDIPGHRVKSADLKVKGNSVAITLTSSYKEEKYEVGYLRSAGPAAGTRN